MAEVLLVYKVVPNDPNVNYEELKSRIRSVLEPKYKVEKIEEEEIGFGIKMLKIYIKMPEASEEHSSDDIENKLMSIESVSGVELEYFTRLGF